MDRLVVRPQMEQRLTESLNNALKHGQGRVILTDLDDGDWRDLAFTTVFACPRCRLALPDLEPRRFSFNNPYGACPRCTGFGQVWEIDPKLLIPGGSVTIDAVRERLGEHLPVDRFLISLQTKALAGLPSAFARPDSRPWDVKQTLADWPSTAVDAWLRGTDLSEPPVPGLLKELHDLMTSEEDDGAAADLQAFAGYAPCPECGGARLNRFARAVTFAGQSLPALTARTVDDASRWFEETPTDADPIAQKIVPEIRQRLRFLQEVGLGYLTLDRPANTLSGGELQRARLATHLGGGLLGVCFVLDEPTLGLHPRDTGRLLDALRHLQERGNTLIVVEHDETVMRHADHLIDIGPGAGRDGGRLLAAGTVDEVLTSPMSVTGRYLRDHRAGGVSPLSATPTQGANAPRSERMLTIRGAHHHNLKNITVALPLGRLVCLTGVSGSGKSSLGRDILVRAVRQHLGLLTPPPGDHDGIDGLEHLDKIIEADQTPLGRSPRSNPASYTGLFDELRKVFAATRLAKVRGYKANRFSFNVKGGRCETCQGQGMLRTNLPVLADVTETCPTCRGRRFNEATLAVRYRDRNIADVLDMTVAEALDFFQNIPAALKPLRALFDVGLGYIKLGQSSATLSGGEAQRVKLAAELAKPTTGRTLIFLDEPTTGLHFADVANLIAVLRQLVAAGNTVVVIEHHLDLIAAADWIIDLGPDAGAAGGQIVAEGTPEEVAQNSASITGGYLR